VQVLQAVRPQPVRPVDGDPQLTRRLTHRLVEGLLARAAGVGRGSSPMLQHEHRKSARGYSSLRQAG